MIAALLIAAVLGVLLVRHHQAERRQSAALARMQEEAAPIERELDRIRQELSTRERALEEHERTACLIVGYQISQRSDVELALRQAEQYDFRPVFVLDPADSDWRDLLDALRDVDGELVLTASPCTEENVRAEDFRSACSDGELSDMDTGCFLLRMNDDTPENLARVAASGYTGCIRHTDAGENTVLENGLVTLSYSQIKSGGFAVKNRLEEGVENGQALLFVFEMDAVRSGALTESDIEQTLELIRTARQENSLAPGTVTDALTLVRTWTETQTMSREAFETYRAEQEQRIEALEAELNEIYARWNREDAA